MSKKIVLAKILTSYGIKGYVKLESYTENPKDIFMYSKNLYDINNKQFIITFISKYKKNVFIAKIDGIESPETAKSWNNTKLYIDIELLKKKSNNEFFYEELLNLNVITTDKKNEGKIVSVNNYGAGIIIGIKWNNEKLEESIPFTDEYFKKIDIKNNLIEIERPVYV